MAAPTGSAEHVAATDSAPPVDALTRTGRVVRIRPANPADRSQLLALNRRSSDRSMYLRFFALNRPAADAYVDRELRPLTPDHQLLVASDGDQIVGVAGFDRLTDGAADVALLIADDHQGQGIGTLLLEQLADIARCLGIRRFNAEVLAVNHPMRTVFRDSGFGLTSRADHEVVTMHLDLGPTEETESASFERDRIAAAQSVRPLLEPRTIAVVGAGNREHSVGHQLLRNLLDSGFTGDVCVVNPHHSEVLGVPSVSDTRDLPFAPDLAIIALPAARVLQTVRALADRHCRGLVVVSAGFGESGAAGRSLQDELLDVARRTGVRLIGPNCLGLVNTDPAIRLNGTFAPMPMRAGGLALVSQSGALGIAVVGAADRRGLGISQFVSVGNKADVSSNDLLCAWERDPHTGVIGLYLESFGNPAKFARIAARVSRRKPIIAIKAGRSVAGRRAGQSHTAAAAASDSVVDALFAAAGVLRVDTMTEFLDAAHLLCNQPVPDGPSVAIVGNSGGPEILAADAAASVGLAVPTLDPRTSARIRAAVPTAPGVGNPVDLGAGAQPAELAAAVQAALADQRIDAVHVVFTETLVADAHAVADVISRIAGRSAKPVVLTLAGSEPATVPTHRPDRSLPTFGFPESATRALGIAWRYRQILAAPARSAGYPAMPTPAVVARMRASDGSLPSGWLPAGIAAELLTAYGIPVVDQRVVRTLAQATRAAAELRYPVVAKAGASVVHKSDVGGVRLGLATRAQLLRAVRELRDLSADGEVTLQAAVQPGLEIIIGGVQDPQFGPVVMVGAGGVYTDIHQDRAFGLAPLGEAEALAMICSLRMNRLFDGFRGGPSVDRAALARVLVAVSRLMCELPTILELDLNPLIGGPGGLICVDAKVRTGDDPGYRARPVHALQPAGPAQR